MKSKRHTIILTIMLMVAIVLAGCGGNESKQGSTDVFLGGDVIEKADSILIEGKSNLLEGSRLIGKVIVDNDEVLADTNEIVDKNGDFTMEMDHQNYGDAEVFVTFDFLRSAQEEEVIEQYGEGGKELEGPYVYVDEHWEVEQINKKAEIHLSLKANDDENEHAFVEPEWGEIPEDYGESRVWFEVDDITNDDDYFYLKGKTNLLEGSMITGKYSEGSDVAETRVNPDGSFNMEIEYKYSEDPYFIIEFKPNRQWPSINENYGIDGKKLVGKNIKTSGDSLSVEEIIEYEHD